MYYLLCAIRHFFSALGRKPSLSMYLEMQYNRRMTTTTKIAEFSRSERELTNDLAGFSYMKF